MTPREEKLLAALQAIAEQAGKQTSNPEGLLEKIEQIAGYALEGMPEAPAQPETPIPAGQPFPGFSFDLRFGPYALAGTIRPLSDDEE